MPPCAGSPPIPNASASARRGSTITMITRRARSPSGCFAARSRSRANSACRSSSIPATPTTTWRPFSGTKWGRGAFSALLHCFTASRALAEAGLELGLSISFSGVVTFKNSAELRAIARDVPLDRILVETDAPYLAPVPYRGKRNEPAFVAATARVVAETRGVEPETLAAATRANTLAIFRKLGPSEPRS